MHQTRGSVLSFLRSGSPSLTVSLQPNGDKSRISKQGAPNEFDINYRELLACAFAIHAWSTTKRAARSQSWPLHVHFRIDNTSAIAWQTNMASLDSQAQVIIRLISLWELQSGLRISASHISPASKTKLQTPAPGVGRTTPTHFASTKSPGTGSHLTL
ncbi:hypothetical protein PF005_g2853 [Phytophthora fragariae]|uniref:Uncharacterized protein n=1 Tax=Phytophthora fragariae TaxID=53985 RepID=A0A6A3Z7T7_9STRA|nr:hypothetical protein PF010_g2475 [Phytophthora fragariae]KAE9232046.1 hypothetical protein PF005_g2853 [Phytophthora fragariae]